MIKTKLIDKLNTSYKYVYNNSKNVKINYNKIDEIIDTYIELEEVEKHSEDI